MMSGTRWIGLSCCLLCAMGLIAAAASGGPRTAKAPAEERAGDSASPKFTVLYDNFLHMQGTAADWGFSCLIEGMEKTILFDMGTQGELLLKNAEALGKDLSRVDVIVLSHEHGDHVGGLSQGLENMSGPTVYIPVSFSEEIERQAREKQARVIRVREKTEICPGVYSTGEMGSSIKEQSLVIDCSEGLVVLTGCAHQGIVEILHRTKDMNTRPLHLVFGGFHLGSASTRELQSILKAFEDLGVFKCGATHCTGDEAIEMFRKAFGDNYLSMGTGRVVEIPLQ